MKMRNSSNGKKLGARRAPRTEVLNLPRLFLFLELFVDKDISSRSTK
ncbi:MAG: hypothetical protein ABSE62_03325 [Chthoniobacteraceae bacterium]